MSLSKHQLKLKQQRRAERQDRKERMDSAAFALHTCAVIAVNSAKRVWKQDATNPKLEQLLVDMFETWEAIADGNTSFEEICQHIEQECKLKYDAKEGSFVNLKAKNQ